MKFQIKFEVPEQTRLAFANLNNAMLKLAENMAKTLKPQFEAIGKAAKHLYELMYQKYLDDGAIYGETQEGFERWMDEVLEYASKLSEVEKLKLLK
jgi:hypothetical protein